MKTIKLSNGKYTRVDKEDYALLIKYKWHVSGLKNYPLVFAYDNNLKTNIIMHRKIMNAEKGIYIDHINHDRFDNRKSNLRFCTQSQNLINSIPRKNISGFRGVSPHGIYWKASIGYDRKKILLGYFKNIYDAVFVRKEAELKYHKEFKYNYSM